VGGIHRNDRSPRSAKVSIWTSFGSIKQREADHGVSLPKRFAIAWVV
jgi:hypothetical protein